MGGDLLTLVASWLVSPALAAGGVPQPGCPTRAERLDLLDEGESALIEADFGTAETKLRALEGAFSCGSVAETDLLARMWLLEGAWMTLQGDAALAGDSFRAAARVGSDVWVSAYGPKLRAQYEAAIAQGAPGSTTLSVEPDLFRWVGSIDGQQTRFPATLTPGLHLVQVGPSQTDTRFSRLVIAFADTPAVVVTGLVEPTGSEPAEPKPGGAGPIAERSVVEHAPWSLYVAGGVSASFGPDPDGDEGGTKLVAPIETGLVWHPTNPLFTRLAFVAGPLLNGDYGWSHGEVATTSPSQLGVHASGGFASNQGELGLLAGYTWPRRVSVRGFVAGHVPKTPFRVEGRIGLALPVGALPETAVDALVAYTPRLVRHRREVEKEP